jgi:hypothetical protein
MCDIKQVAFTSKVMKKSQLMDYMVSLHFIDFISWGVLDNAPLYCITLWTTILYYSLGGDDTSQGQMYVKTTNLMMLINNFKS